MSNISLIAAVGDKNNALGKGNDLIWHLPGDLKFFKNVTMGKDVVMGSNTFYSLPKMLPNRRHIVLTSKNIEIPEVLVIHSKEELIKYLYDIKREVMVIGGASVYAQMIEYADKMYLTHIDATCDEADTYFPEIHYDEWDITLLGTNEDNGIKYEHKLYTRKRNRY